MACMTHTCWDCGAVTCNNLTMHRCPVCGGMVSSQFDEVVEEDDELHWLIEESLHVQEGEI